MAERIGGVPAAEVLNSQMEKSMRCLGLGFSDMGTQSEVDGHTIVAVKDNSQLTTGGNQKYICKVTFADGGQSLLSHSEAIASMLDLRQAQTIDSLSVTITKPNNSAEKNEWTSVLLLNTDKGVEEVTVDDGQLTAALDVASWLMLLRVNQPVALAVSRQPQSPDLFAGGTQDLGIEIMEEMLNERLDTIINKLHMGLFIRELFQSGLVSTNEQPYIVLENGKLHGISEKRRTSVMLEVDLNQQLDQRRLLKAAALFIGRHAIYAPSNRQYDNVEGIRFGFQLRVAQEMSLQMTVDGSGMVTVTKLVHSKNDREARSVNETYSDARQFEMGDSAFENYAALVGMTELAMTNTTFGNELPKLFEQ